MFWWELGLVNRQAGKEFSPTTLACPYCTNHGNFVRVFRAEKRGDSPQEDYISDVWQCQICSQESFVQWHTEKGMVDYRVYPPSMRHGLTEALPIDMADEYQQALNAYLAEKWDVTVVLSRRLIDLVAKATNIEGEDLLDVLGKLVKEGLLTNHILRWARSIEELSPGSDRTKSATQESARQLLMFTRWVLDLNYLLPHTIERYK